MHQVGQTLRILNVVFVTAYLWWQIQPLLTIQSTLTSYDICYNNHSSSQAHRQSRIDRLHDASLKRRARALEPVIAA